jgi:hypothetical protein
MPIDKFSLSVMANVKEAHTALIEINNLINKDLKSAYDTFKSNMNGSNFEFSEFDNLSIFNLGLEKHISGNLQTDSEMPTIDFSFLKYYENLFKYISTV